MNINNVWNEGTDGSRMTPTYEFTTCTPKTHSVVCWWGEHHLIIVNNLQAGPEQRDMGQNGRWHFWQNYSNRHCVGAFAARAASHLHWSYVYLIRLSHTRSLFYTLFVCCSKKEWNWLCCQRLPRPGVIGPTKDVRIGSFKFLKVKGTTESQFALWLQSANNLRLMTGGMCGHEKVLRMNCLYFTYPETLPVWARQKVSAE